MKIGDSVYYKYQNGIRQEGIVEKIYKLENEQDIMEIKIGKKSYMTCEKKGNNWYAYEPYSGAYPNKVFNDSGRKNPTN